MDEGSDSTFFSLLIGIINLYIFIFFFRKAMEMLLKCYFCSFPFTTREVSPKLMTLVSENPGNVKKVHGL